MNSNLLNDIPVEKSILCRCLNVCPDGSDNSTCVLKPHAKCFKKIFLNDEGETEVQAGCLGSQKDYIDQCNQLAEPDFLNPTDLKCCNNGSLCNDHLIVRLPTTPTDHSDGIDIQQQNIIIVIAVTVTIFFIIFGSLIAFYCCKTKRQEKARKRQIEVENQQVGCSMMYGDAGRCKGNGKYKGIGDMLDEWSSLAGTSSGSGMPLLVQRTISKQIEPVREIGRGRYGTVMLGKWRDENVALKIFNSTDEDSWFRETEIYQTVMLRHENILGFIAADISGQNSWTELFLITEYHENGSLFDYLHKKDLDVSEAIKLAYTACCGLAHLHTEITGTQGKPSIAHRDVKSKNILVKRDGQCCIADMGLAVRYSRLEGKVDIGSYDRSRRQGTKRYMAPEVITQTYHPDSFAAYKASDVYSFALVMWEIANRTAVKGVLDEYHPPYYDAVGSDPDFDEMKKVVVIENMRPEIQPEWTSHRVMNTYVTTMQECWVSRHESRLSMLRVRKTFNSINEGKFQKAVDSSVASSDSERKPSASSTLSSNSISSNKLENNLLLHPELMHQERQPTFLV